jgi:hypothetical protein
MNSKNKFFETQKIKNFLILKLQGDLRWQK